jgi:hypothetical protein
MKRTTITAIGSLLAAVTLTATAVTPVFAAGLGLHATTNVRVNLGTDQAKADASINARITALNSLQTRINAMTKVSASDKASLDSAIQTSLQNMTTLEAKINADTVAATLKTDVQSITKDNRIYMLIIPQGRIEASADREESIVSLMDTLGTNLQTRITADASDSNASAMQSLYADFQAKVADANIQANAAVTLVANLQADQGNTSVMSSNNAALKQAVADIKVGTTDLKTARTDAGTIVTDLKADESVKTSTSTSASSSTSASAQ